VRLVSALREAIAAQAQLLAHVLSVDIDEAVARIEPARRVWFVGTGTSQHAAELATWMFHGGKQDVRWASSAGFVQHEPDLIAGEDAVVVISHTAETAFARRARRHALDAGVAVVSITGQGKGWAEAVETVPSERSQTYTVSYTSALVVLARLAVALGRAPFGAEQLSELPERVRAAAESGVMALKSPPERLIVLVGIGPGAITAREGALKLREAAKLAAEGYEAEYFLHGSAVPLGPRDGMLVIQPGDDSFGLLTAIAEAAALEGLTVAAVEEPVGLHPALAQIPLTARLQALASRWADDRGVDPDKVITAGWAKDPLWSAGAPQASEQ
jgi:glutamine---fructose-6-phosphate transaminase (isomerizing)